MPARPPAVAANHIFTISARAPAGSVKRKKGNDATVDIREGATANSSACSLSRSPPYRAPPYKCPISSWQTRVYERPGFCNEVQVR